MIRIILEKDKLVDELAAKVKELEEKVKAEQKKRVEKFAKPNTANKRKKRPGQKLGHVGMTRAAPDHIDEAIEETLRECPECHHALGEAVEVEEQIQENIVPAHARARKAIKGLLGQEFDGTLISDFFSVYLNLPYRMQKCLVHLSRDFHECAKTDRTEEFVTAYRQKDLRSHGWTYSAS